MRVQPVAFAGSGPVGTSAHDAVDNFGATVRVPAEVELVVGLAFTGFTKVIAHNGSDVSGDIVAVCDGEGTYGWNYELACPDGLYLECIGAGRGTVWLV